MLHEFLLMNRDTILARARDRVASRMSPTTNEAELDSGLPIFLEQLGDALRLAESGRASDNEQIGVAAARQGADMLRLGLTIAQVVHGYGDVCQVITGLAVEQSAPIPPGEFRTLNLCLDDAIAEAVSEYSRQAQLRQEDRGTERLGVLAHELRNLVNSAMLSYEMLKGGTVAVGGSTGLVLGRSLVGLRDLVDRSLTDVRIEAGVHHVERLSVAEIVEEVEIGALLQAQSRDQHLKVTIVDRTVSIEADRLIIVAAVSNLLQNAFKFTPRNGNISLTTRVTSDLVLFEVEDECGGLPPGKAEELFLPFQQRGHDRSGLGLGLSICLKAARSSGGALLVRDLHGKGCIFTLSLPRKPPPPLSLVGPAHPRGSSPPGAAGQAPSATGPTSKATATTGTGEDRPRSVSTVPERPSTGCLQGLRVLLVEDNDDARDLLHLLLAKHGAVVTLAANGIDALPLLRARPGIVLTDVSMPRADGFAVLRATRALLGRTPCLAVSAHAFPHDGRTAIEAGFDAHFAEPVDCPKLVKYLAAWHASTARAHEREIATDGGGAEEGPRSPRAARKE